MRLGPTSILFVLGSIFVASTPARAATYVDPSVESRGVVGLAMSTSSAGDGATGLAGAGVELESGWAWEHGLSLVATFGEMRHARGDALTTHLGLFDARAVDDAVGLRARGLASRADFAPFAQASLAADRVRFSGEREGSALGASAALGIGLRLRVEPWELALAVDARRTWLEAPFADVDAIAVTRLVATLGARLDW
jgi:hypothetical protein